MSDDTIVEPAADAPAPEAPAAPEEAPEAPAAPAAGETPQGE